MATHKPFREIVPPNSNFEFIGRIKTWAIISTLLISASIGMLFVNKSMRGDYLNWTIDFKGGTEIILGFKKAGTDKPATVSSGDVRNALENAGYDGFVVSDFAWQVELDDGTETTASGMLVRTPDFGAVPVETQEAISLAMPTGFPDLGIIKATWSGDRIFVRSTAALDWEQMRIFLEQKGLILKPWGDEKTRFTSVEEGTGEFNAQLSIKGIDEQYRKVLAADLGEGITVEVINVYGVGAKAGDQLRNDGIKSLFYAMALIMLYLAFRFDIRYAPGAVIALLHDAILVVGVFALTWKEVSLTSVAALLTVIGYSVNDSVVIFDRIRENVGRLKDKKFGRIINISLNETMSRTLLTSITLFVVTMMMNIFGTGLVANFAFAMNIGVVVGVYSSIFIAAPVALGLHNRYFAAGGKKSDKPAPTKRPSGSKSTKKPATKMPKEAPEEPMEVSDDISDDDNTEASESPVKKKATKRKAPGHKSGRKKPGQKSKKTGAKKK